MDERIELARRAYRTFNDGDVDYSLFHPELCIVQTSSLAGTTGTFMGHDGLRRSAEQLREGFEELRFEPEEYTELEDGRLLMHCRFVGRGTRSGIELHADGWHILTFRDGLLSRLEIYPSRRRALAAAGQPS
ncbi:MAG TPA: nuclear transport factor 2 family protein [Thermoleophilaceae bacterium]|nr:nuclear transport factor 2 family protein [Thermoleophilaceae bacterium]